MMGNFMVINGDLPSGNDKHFAMMGKILGRLLGIYKEHVGYTLWY